MPSLNYIINSITYEFASIFRMVRQKPNMRNKTNDQWAVRCGIEC